MRAAGLAALAVTVLVLLAARPAGAHGMRTAYVEITEHAPGRARVAIRGKVPVTGVELVTAPPCAITATPDTGRQLSCPERLAGAALELRGLGPVVSEAVVFVTLASGESFTTCVTPGNPRWEIPGRDPGALAVAGRYVKLGVEHIGTGADHLLFLLALVLCLRSLRAVMLAETAFTLSHTLSFTASALGWIRVSAAAAEACIAVSLVLIALDIGGPRREAAWKTAGLAFVFGLVHGLGFAGGLAEIGLPATAVPAALAGFAGGVELGQLAFLLLAVGALRAVERAPAIARAAVTAGAYAVGGVGWFWLIERLGALRA